MSSETISEIVIGIISENAANPVTRETVLSDAGIDSFDLVEAMDLEWEFDDWIPELDAEKWKTVGDVIEYIEKLAV